ncbi:hypothetical protein [Bacillus phage BUCT083]|nr:hypothetical protein [Bacillus phage BUCT083]
MSNLRRPNPSGVQTQGKVYFFFWFDVTIIIILKINKTVFNINPPKLIIIINDS